jgi:predicted membrane protein
MYPKGWKQQFMEAMALLFVISFVVHLAALWLAPLVPVVVALGIVGVVYRLVLGRWRR